MTELKDLFLPYEESLAMRELGFDEPCLAFFNEVCEENDKANCSGRFQTMLGWVVGRETTNDLTSHDFLVISPLYQQTLDFFRKKGYHIEIYSDNHQDILNADNWYWLFSKGVNTSCTDSFGSYEEARLDCIRALIKTELNNKS